MRRIDHEPGQVARQGPPPFRLLPDTAYLSPGPPPPPPPRAPEPYKIGPSTTSFGKPRRRSSFVILAETARAPSPESGDASPTLPTSAGRVSPFRGRGFKGPPPHSMSRPQSPEAAGDGRRRRLERRVSVSQQNSPRRSLIPQPTYRQRSVSLTKATDRSPSPKIGRRIDSRTRLSVSGSRGRSNASDSKPRPSDARTRLNRSESRGRGPNLAEPRIRFISSSASNLTSGNNGTPTRRQPASRASATRLSPIQGTPTKPERRNARGNSSRTSPAKAAKTTTTTNPPRKSNLAATSRRDSHQDKSVSKEQVVSPSKIPLKRNNKANGATLASSNSGRFISMPEQSTEKPRRAIVVTENENGDGQMDSQAMRDGRSLTHESNSKENQVDGNCGRVDDVHLMDLLKQAPQLAGTATSSERLVNTTTTTAVQPLHIDANTLLVEHNETTTTTRGNQQRDRYVDGAKSPVSPASKNEVADEPGSVSALNPAMANRSDQPGNPGDDEAGTRSSSFGQTARNVARMSSDSSALQHSGNQSSANLQRAGKAGDHNARGAVKPSDARLSGDLEETTSMTSTAGVKVNSAGDAGMVAAGGREVPPSDRMSAMESTPRRAENETTRMTTTTMTSDATRGNGQSASPPIGAADASAGAATRTRIANRGSDASLKSSTGVSTDSIASVRSTDTGVSVNTVRGVSSPREKTGVHVVKRQEIETLSGNVMRVEQNGEPAVLGSNGNGKPREQRERLLERWGRSLSHYCGHCCSSMRCLACRRDPKGGLLWARNQKGRTINDNDNNAAARSSPPIATIALDDASAPPPPPSAATNALSSCWSKLRTRCRCARLREIRCCTRRSRIAPAESTARCCPPERRFGAICRRAFACCSRKQRLDNQAQQRAKNAARAKHSLTSVAPPILSEDTKAKLPDVLVEHNSVMRGAIPCLPLPLAWFCLIWNVLLPGTGTVWSGLFNLCMGQPRFSAVASMKSRLGAFVVNLVVGVGQLFTVLFCLVGWGWSIWWGITMVRLARKYKRVRDSEAASKDPEARGGQPAGAPSQTLRGMERAR